MIGWMELCEKAGERERERRLRRKGCELQNCCGAMPNQNRIKPVTMTRCVCRCGATQYVSMAAADKYANEIIVVRAYVDTLL